MSNSYGTERIDLNDGSGRALYTFPAKHGREVIVVAANPTGRWLPGVYESEDAARASLSLRPAEIHALQTAANRRLDGAKVITLHDIHHLGEILAEAQAAHPLWTPPA